MSVHKHQKKIFWAIVVTETSHIFCCVLPTLFSLAALLSGLGMIATVPGWLETLHHIMHGWELPVLIFSGVMIALGWGLHFFSKVSDCHDHGCEHEPCGPRHRRASKILIVASVLFALNAIVYFGIHRPQDRAFVADMAEHVEAGHDDHSHGHNH